MPKKRSKKAIQLDEHQKLEAEEAFKALDKEDTGAIETKDLKKALSTLGLKLANEEINKIIKDVEDDGQIFFEDFLDVVAVQMERKASSEDVGKIFALFDVDKKGKISIKDLRRVNKELDEKIPEEELEEMIAHTDLNGDGHINQEEFKMILIKTGIL